MTERQKITSTNERKNNKIETRTRARISHDAKVHVLLGSDVFKGSLRDISQQGLYFFSNDVQNIASQNEQSVFVELFMEHGESTLAVETRGFVVRTDEKGCAISFSHTLLWWPVFSVFPTRGGEDEEHDYAQQDIINPEIYDPQIANWDIGMLQ